MPTNAEVNEAFRKVAEKHGRKYVPTTARDLLRGHTALMAIGRFGPTPATPPPEVAGEFKDAGAYI